MLDKSIFFEVHLKQQKTLKKQMKVTNLGPFGPIVVKNFPDAPKLTPVGYRLDDGVVKFLLT